MKALVLAALAATGVLATFSSLPASSPPHRNELTEAQWRQDLQALANGIRKRHVAPFNFLAKPRFDEMVAALSSRIGNLDRDHILTEFHRIAASVGDAHTHVRMPPEEPRYPLSISRFNEQFRVTAAGQAHRRALGARVLKIDEVPVEDAFKRLMAIQPANETSGYVEALAAAFLNIPMLLHGLDVTGTSSNARYTLLDDAGQSFVEEVRAAPLESVQWVSASIGTPLSRANPKETFWCQAMPEASAVYCNFRSYSDLRSRSAAMLGLIQKTGAAKLIIDLRQNGGGDYKVGNRYVISPIRQLPEINRKGSLFVLVGPLTNSAAMVNSVQFREQTNAILVGRSIGEKPNSYSENDEFRLPHSRRVVSYSTRYYKFVEGENIVRPDKEIITTWEAFKAGRDLPLEYALAYR